MIEKDICKLLADLVAIPSVNPGFSDAPAEFTGEEALAEYIIRWSKTHKIHCQKICAAGSRPCVLLETGPKNAPVILLSAHMDTVWTADMDSPFVLKERNGFLHGLGAVDDKGALAAALTAIKRLNGKKLNFKFQLLASCDEEYGLCGIKKVIPAESSPQLHIVSEPTALKIVTASKGSARFKVTVSGKKAHSSMPHLGENAILKATKLIEALQKYSLTLPEKRVHPLLGSESLSIGTISGGTQPSIVPDRCEFSFNYRILPGNSPENLLNDLKNLLNKTGIPFELSASFDAVPSEISAENIWVRRMCNTLKKNSFDPQLYGVPYASEASQSAKYDIPVFLLGPGDIDTAHTAGECIKSSELAKMSLILEDFLSAEDIF